MQPAHHRPGCSTPTSRCAHAPPPHTTLGSSLSPDQQGARWSRPPRDPDPKTQSSHRVPSLHSCHRPEAHPPHCQTCVFHALSALHCCHVLGVLVFVNSTCPTTHTIAVFAVACKRVVEPDLAVACAVKYWKPIQGVDGPRAVCIQVDRRVDKEAVVEICVGGILTTRNESQPTQSIYTYNPTYPCRCPPCPPLGCCQ